MERFGVLGISHRRATVEEIGRFAEALARHESLLQEIGLSGFLVLSTCNRVELYWTDPARRSGDEILRAVAARLFAGDSETRELALSACYALEGQAVVKHLFAVLSGLDSLVPGDEQIVGQFKTALHAGRSSETVGKDLSFFGDEALKAARRVRAGMEFSKRPTSVGEVAALALREHLRGTIQGRVVLVGVSEMIRITASRIKHWEGVELTFVNRTVEKAKALASLHGGTAQSLAEFQAHPSGFDALVVATSSSTPLLNMAHLGGLPEVARPRLLLDLGVPANLDPALGDEAGFQRLDVLELGARAKVGRAEAENLARQARPALRDSLAAFRERLLQRDLGPVAEQMRREVEKRAQAELARFLKGSLSHLSEEDRDAVERLIARVSEKTVQVPLTRMRKSLRQLPMSQDLLAHLGIPMEEDPGE
ncbi:MAG: hypothetical protein MK213_05340 [Planctomycetes bacterium]|nr:hypothetical protein [Planctomycetota bacterium]